MSIYRRLTLRSLAMTVWEMFEFQKGTFLGGGERGKGEGENGEKGKRGKG